MKFFNSHLSAQQIADAIDSSAELTADLSAHLAGCAHCTQEHSSFSKAIKLMRDDNSHDAPQTAFNFAVNLFRTRRQFAPKRTIAAILKLNLSNSAPAFGERSGGVFDERQMLFAAGEFDIDVRVRSVENGFAVRGQILGELNDNCFLRFQNQEFKLETAIDEHGTFAFAPLPALDDVEVSLIFK